MGHNFVSVLHSYIIYIVHILCIVVYNRIVLFFFLSCIHVEALEVERIFQGHDDASDGFMFDAP